MKTRIDDNTHVKHDKEWQSRFRNWAFSRIRSFESKDLIPSDAIYMTTEKGSFGVRHIFQVPIPKPRNLLTLDGLLGESFEDYYNKRDLELDVMGIETRFRNHIKTTVFISTEETEWYEEHRSLGFAIELDKAVPTYILLIENRK